MYRKKIKEIFVFNNLIFYKKKNFSTFYEKSDYYDNKNLKNDDEVVDSKEFSFSELKECLYNRGKVYGFDITEDKMAIEIWLEKDDGMHCYYFFKYGEGVIEC